MQILHLWLNVNKFQPYTNQSSLALADHQQKDPVIRFKRFEAEVVALSDIMAIITFSENPP